MTNTSFAPSTNLPARIDESHAAGMADEQCYADLVLHITDTPTDRRFPHFRAIAACRKLHFSAAAVT